MHRRVVWVVLALVVIAAAAGFSYLQFSGTHGAQPGNGDLVVNAKAYNGTAWNEIKVQLSVDNRSYDTPFRYSVVRFTAHVVQAPSSAPGNYSFAEWETGQKSLSRTVSLDFDSGNLSITAYYSVAEHPRIYTFEDGFENGLSAWTGKLVTNGADPVISTSVMRTGTASCRFQTNPTLSNASSMVFKTISTTNDVYARAYVYIPEGIVSLQRDDRFYLMRIVYGSSENLLASLGIRRNGNEPAQWCLITAKNSSSTGIPKYGQIVNASLVSNTWTCLEMHWNKTGGVVEAWVNGEKQITASATPGDMSPASNIQFGIYKKGDDGIPPPTGQYEAIAYVDDCIIDDKPIGP
ncbi:polysaccharide lyase [Candidatus Bathyarchaeota archaeon]|nr:polysaccharide lyase [Candidatus Bathyarchaeota archaeon]